MKANKEDKKTVNPYKKQATSSTTKPTAMEKFLGVPKDPPLSSTQVDKNRRNSATTQPDATSNTETQRRSKRDRLLGSEAAMAASDQTTANGKFSKDAKHGASNQDALDII